MSKPVRGDRIEILVNGEWHPAEHVGPARKPSEFWTRTDAGGVFCVRYGYEGYKWRWPKITSEPGGGRDTTEE